MNKEFLAKKKEINTLKTDVNVLKATDERIWTNLDTINKTASTAKIKAEEGVAKADDALAATRTNTSNINTLKTDVNALKATDERIWTNLDTINRTASTAKIKAEEGVAKADSALARNIFTDEEKAKLANITNPMIIKGRVDTVEDLPTEAVIGWFYFVGLESASSYEEYCYSENGWEFIGVSREGVDLSNYYTKAQVDSKDQALQDALDATNVVVGDLTENLQAAYNKINTNTTDISELREDINSNIAYGTCTSEATTTKKEVTLYNNPNWKLKNGSIVSVRFTSAVSANSTLSVNGEAAKSIHYKGSAITDNIIKEGDTATFIYNTQFHLVAFDKIFVEGANKLTTNAGSTTKPVYFEDGIPKECSYTLGEAASRGVDTEPTNLSDDLITSGAVYEAVTELNEKTDATNSVVGNLSNSLQPAYNSINSLKNEVAINKTTLGYQTKNLLKNTVTTTTVSGVTFTINDDKSITVNGTATAQISFIINNKVGLGIGNYILTGCPSGGSWNTFYLTAYASSAWLTAPDFGSGCKIENKIVTQVVITIASGYTANNLKFYPMLRDADITNNTYEPYKESVDTRLTENTFDIAVNKTTLGYQCKNLLKNNAVTKTVNGVTFTVNPDGSVTVNGTNTSSSTGANLEICGFKNYGDIKLTASLNSTDSNLYMSVFDKNWVGVGIICDNEVTWDNGNKERLVRLVVKPGATINNVTVYPMIRYADITDDTYEPYKESVDERLVENKSNIAVNKSTLGYQCKNLLKIVPRTITSGGVTCVIDDDGIVTVNGTASETVFINIRSNISLDETLEYTLTGTYDNSSYGYIYYQFGETTDGTTRYNDTGNGVTFKGAYGSVYLRIPAGAVLNNVKYYPMLRYADITDSTYEPYKESVDERITNNVSDIAINKSTLGYQCKNLLKNTAKTSTVNGITFTVNTDKSVTANGTNSALNYANILVFKGELEAGTYILSGAVSDVFRIRLGLGTTDVYGSYVGIEIGNGYTFTVTEKAIYTVTCQIASGKTASNVIFKPMLRYADITDDTYEPYQPSLVDRCLLKDTAGINLGHVQSSSITIDNLSAYTALWVNVSGGVSGINFQTNLIVPIAYLAKSSSNRVSLAGGIPSSAYVTSEGPVAAKYMDGTITAKVSGNTLDLTISDGTIGSIEVISLM